MNRCLLAILLLLPASLRAADSTPHATEPAVTLSPYEVRANSVEFKHWIKIGSPNFILYTDASEAEASRALREFEMLHFAGQIVFGRKAAQVGPTILILPTARSDWRKLDTKGGNTEWQSVAAKVGGRVVDVVIAQYDWEEDGLGYMRAVMASGDMGRMDLAAPFWLSRGFSMFYETAEFDGDKVRLGHVNPRIRGLKDQRWLPWGRFFEVNPSSPEFRKENLISRYEAQVAVFTQFMFTNPDRAWIGRLASWVEYLYTGAPPTEAQFATIFGQDWRQWQRTMESYLETGRYDLFQVQVPAQFSHYKETKFKLPVQEMRELFILTQTLVQQVADSRVSLDALLAGGLQSEPLRELLIEACLEWDRRAAALQNVRKLIADGTTNPRVYRTGDAVVTMPEGEFRLNLRYGPEVTEVDAWDRRGLELEPLYTNLNESLAVNEACGPVIDQQSITTIEECYMRIRGRAPTDRVITALAMALWRNGDTKTASELAIRLKNDPLVNKRSYAIATELLERIGAKNGTAAAPPTASNSPVPHATGATDAKEKSGTGP